MPNQILAQLVRYLKEPGFWLILMLAAAVLLYLSQRNRVVISDGYYNGIRVKAIDVRRTAFNPAFDKISCRIIGSDGYEFKARTFTVPKGQDLFQLKWVDQQYGPMHWGIETPEGTIYTD